MAATLLLERCNPYGAETGGPRRVMAGLHGPGSAATPDMDLPDNVAQGEWLCLNQAQVRVRMECRCGHRGEPMNLCSVHDEIVYRADPLNWRRKISEVIQVTGHYEEIQRRQCGLCLRCAYPAGRGFDFAAEYKNIEAYQGQLAYLNDRGAWRSRQAEELRQKVIDIVAKFDEGIERGQIHKCPLRLIPVS